MGHKHSVRDTNARFLIDQYTRVIKNDSANKTTIVQYDHNSERLTFEMPLRVDEHTMTLCNLIEIHFINISIDGKEQRAGVYEVNDIKAEGDKAIFTWLVSQNATQLAGSLNFFISFKCIEDGVTVYRWGTEICKTLAISSGMDNGEEILVDYPDILAQWKTELFNASDSAVMNVMTAEAKALAEFEAATDAKQEAVLNSIPAEYSELSATADHNYQNKAGAIVVEAQGKTIAVNDASEYPLQNLRVFGKSKNRSGKNLLNLPQTISKPMSSSQYNLFTGLALEEKIENPEILPRLPAGTYFFHVEIESTGDDAVFVKKVADDGTVGINYTDFLVTNSGTFTLDEESLICVCVNTTEAATIRNIQIEQGDRFTGYEPYMGGPNPPSPENPKEIISVENPVVSVYGKNLMPPRVDTTVYAGLTFTGNVDGTVSVAGTVNEGEDSVYHIVQKDFPLTLPKGDYLISGSVGGSEKTYRILVYATDWTLLAENCDSSTLFSLDRETDVFVYIWVARGTTIDKTFYPMIRSASISAEAFESHKKEAVSIPRTIRGIPVSSGGNYTDADGQQWICDEVDFARGAYVQRINQLLFNGSENWGEYDFQSTYSGFSLHNALDEIHSRTQGMSNQFSNFKQSVEDGIWVGVGNTSLYAITKEWYNKGLDAWKTHLNEKPLVVIYPRHTPIETALSDAEINAFKALYSNKPNTVVFNDAEAHMAVDYVADTKIYIDNQISALLKGSE